MVDSREVAVLLALSTTFGLALVVVMARHVTEEVHGPAEELLAKRMEEGRDRGLLGQLVELVDHTADAAGVLVAGLGDEDHVALQVAGGLVVLTV